MTADCTDYDALCVLQADMDRYVEERTVDEQIERGMFVLGTFNGRVYTYSEIDGRTVIMAVDVNPDGSQKANKIGKFEMPDEIPVSYLESDGTVDDTGGVNHGR